MDLLGLQLQLREDASAEFASALRAASSATGASGHASSLVPPALRRNYAGGVDAVRSMVRDEGLLSLYRGLGPSLLLVSHSSLQFVSYENLKLFFGGAAGAGGGAAGQPGSRELFAAATCSKLVATLGTYPYQVVRSCMQQRAVVGDDRVAVEGTYATAARIWRGEGARGFYRGLLPHMLRSTPQSTVTLMAYEYILRLTRSLRTAE